MDKDSSKEPPVKWVKIRNEHGRLEDKSPTNKKTRINIGDLRTRAPPIRRQG